jgi:hypothetical protein
MKNFNEDRIVCAGDRGAPAAIRKFVAWRTSIDRQGI